MKFIKQLSDRWAVKDGVVTLAHIHAEAKCTQCGGKCFQLKTIAGHVEHHEKLWGAKDSAKKLAIPANYGSNLKNV